MRSATPLLLVLASLAVEAQTTPRWRIRYSYDQDKTSLQLADLAAPANANNESLVIAVGDLWTEPRRGRPTPQAVLSRDEGKTWQTVKLPASPVSTFFVSPRLGWFVDASGSIYRTSDGARTWDRVSKLNGALRLHFFDEGLGYAVGLEKGFWKTIDGGRKWTAVPAGAEPNTKKETTAYTVIAFRNEKIGMVVGASVPQRRGPYVPRWIDPDSASARRQQPNISITIGTTDGGATWTPNTSSIFGQITQWAPAASGEALTLVEFTEGFSFPSEVYRWSLGKLERVFREEHRAVKDVAIDALGRGWIAAVEIPGDLNTLPIPGKIHVYQSLDLKNWAPIAVDYKAFGTRVMLDVRNAVRPWAATDAGQILRFE